VSTLTFTPVIQRVSWQTGIGLESITSVDIGMAIGYQPKTVQRWMRRGAVDWKYGDRIAINLGWHPCVLWPEEWNQFDE
jgi:hypothetical protein